jgi:hypothetical protein
MRYILLIYQNTEAWKGLAQEDKDVFMHAAGDIVDVATPKRSEEIAARWPDAQHWGLEIRALIHGGGEEG